MIVVSNSSPLISLGAIGRFELLHELFGEISIPLAVWQVLGLLVDSKRTGLIEKLRPVLEELREKAGFRISAALYEQALQEVGEAERSRGEQ